MSTNVQEDRLAEIARTGNEDELSRHLLPIACRMVRGVLRCFDPHLIESAAHDAVLAACRNRHRFRGDAHFTSWLYTIVRRAALRRARAEKRYKDLLTADGTFPLSGEADPIAHAAPFVREEALSFFESAVSNPDWRLMWLMRNDPDLRRSHEEIAAELGYTVGSVSATLSKVRKLIAAAGNDADPVDESAGAHVRGGA